jgi:hypothetical protein
MFHRFCLKKAAGVRMAVVAAACVLSPALLQAELGMEMTQGSDGYVQRGVSLNVGVAPSVTCGLGYSESNGSGYADPSRTYAANLGLQVSDRVSVNGGGAHTPAANGERSDSWNAGATWSRWGERFSWGLGLTFAQTIFAEYWQSQTTVERLRGKARTTTTTESGWQKLNQGSIGPSLTFDVTNVAGFRAGYSTYFYDRDVSGFSDSLAGTADPVTVTRGNTRSVTSTDLGNLSSLVSGFPGHILSAGVTLWPEGRVQFACDWSRTAYALDEPPVESSAFSLAYTFGKFLRVRVGYTLLSNRVNYVVMGMHWLW